MDIASFRGNGEDGFFLDLDGQPEGIPGFVGLFPSNTGLYMYMIKSARRYVHRVDARD
jgi:hypothetical protein